jgi:pimeloyl-ACP methyl ester carboxylesterase
LLAPDLRGHGATAAVHDLGDIARWIDDLDALLGARGLQQAALVGHSLGAQVATHFAAQRPARVSSLFLVDPVLPTALHPKNQWFVRALPLFSLAAKLVRAGNRLGFYRRHLAPLDLRKLDEAARIALRSPGSADAFIRQYTSTRADLKHIHTAQYLQDLIELLQPPPALDDIRCPVRVLLSTGATFASEPATRRDLSALRQVSFASIDCHHWPLTERPTEVREMIERWIAVESFNR